MLSFIAPVRVTQLGARLPTLMQRTLQPIKYMIEHNTTLPWGFNARTLPIPAIPSGPCTYIGGRIAAFVLPPRKICCLMKDDQQYRMGRWKMGKLIGWACWSWEVQEHSCWRRRRHGLRLYSRLLSHYLRRRCRC